MTPSNLRSRASTLQDRGPEVSEFRTQLALLEEDNLTNEPSETIEKIHVKLQALQLLRRSLLEILAVPHVRDTFRHLNGFHTLIVVLNHVSQLYMGQAETSDDLDLLSESLLQAIFGVLAAAIQDHKGNQKYFRQRVNDGGWKVVKRTLFSVLSYKFEKADLRYEHLVERVYGCLLACALNDESMRGFFNRLNRLLDVSHTPSTDSESIQVSSAATGNRDSGVVARTTEFRDRLGRILKRELEPLTVVYNEDAILLIYELWKDLGGMTISESISDVAAQNAVRAVKVVPHVIHHLAKLSTSNLVALHGTGLASSLLNLLLTHPNAETHLVSELRSLTTLLLELGVTNLDDAHLLYRGARSSPLVAELLLTSLKSSRSPSYIHFDLSSNGFASVELPGIGRAFPPTGSSAGYTLSLWLQIIQYDTHAHTTLFGAFDASQTCFVLLYLEKDTHNLILQTSVSSTRPSVRFKTISFKQGQWYHVVIAHRRPKTTSSSRASLFIDGEFIEQVKSQYPMTPPLANGPNNNAPSPSSNRRTGAIQAFLGTPQDLASHLEKGKVLTQWRLASVNLFADVLSDDLIAVYFELGPRYTGNFQDCLGSFQTYRASAALNLRNESLHPGKEERSDIVTAIRSKASSLLPESTILLNVSANLVLDDIDTNNIDETYLLNLISKAAGKNLRNVTRGGRNALAINGAIPSINEALLRSSGYAVLTGNPTVVVPISIDNAAWGIGGCAAVGLALLEAAQEPEEVLRALKILFESVQQNWRNSEAMERENGFGVLSTLISTKLSAQRTDSCKNSNPPDSSRTDRHSASPLALLVLNQILSFVGYCSSSPEDSVINNPLAYRILLVDMEFWRIATPQVQKLYYAQFVVFGIRSKYHVFNMKRLSRMRQSLIVDL